MPRRRRRIRAAHSACLLTPSPQLGAAQHSCSSFAARRIPIHAAARPACNRLPPCPFVPPQYKPAPPLTIPSAAYTTVLAETFRLGRNDSSDRTQQQTDTAKFWADGNTTSTVAGHFNQIAQVLLPTSISTKKAAQLFAELNAATWDASIAGENARFCRCSLRLAGARGFCCLARPGT